ncbi:MAG: tetratricopeptide repeat protein [Pyrinomonadaceae bacterium]
MFKVFVKVSMLLALAILLQPLAVRAQEDPPPKPPAPRSGPSGPVVVDEPVMKVPDDPRERRAAAYAKLLEAQRQYFTLRRSNNDLVVNRTLALMRKTLDQAILLDPKLAEALTLRAELAFYFPPTDWAEAERLATRAAAANPDNLGAHRLLSRIYSLQSGLGRKKVDETIAAKAIEELRQVTRLSTTDTEGWALLSEFYDQAGRTEEALNAMQRWSAAPETMDGRFYSAVVPKHELSTDAAFARLGATLIKSGDPAAAITPIIRAITLDSKNGEYVDLLQAAIDESGMGTDAIVSELKRLVATSPDGLGLLRVLAATQARAGKVDDAVATLRSGLARVDKEEDNQESWLLRENLTEIYLDAGNYDGAIAVYGELLQRAGIGDAPLASDSDREMAGELIPRIIAAQKSAGKYAEAAQSIERLRRLFGPGDSTADEQNVALLRDQRKLREALAAVRAARLKFPTEPGLARLEAAILTDTGKVAEGVAILRSKLAPASDSAPTSNDFILMLTISGLYSQAGLGTQAVAAAREALDKAPASNPGFTTAALLTLASAQERSKDTKGAEETLRKILERDPTNATAMNNLGYFLADRGERLTEALDLIKRAVRAEPKNSSFLDSLGWAYFKLGKFDEAERYLTNALRRNPTSFTLNDHLGDIYHGQSKLEQARAAWQRAISASLPTDDVTPVKAKLNGKIKQ